MKFFETEDNILYSHLFKDFKFFFPKKGGERSIQVIVSIIISDLKTDIIAYILVLSNYISLIHLFPSMHTIFMSKKSSP